MPTARIVLPLAAAAALAVGCAGTSPAANQGPATGPTSSAPASRTTTPPPPARSGSASPSAEMAECAAARLTVTLGFMQGAAGHLYLPLLFRNRASVTCWTAGYPGVAGLDSTGRQVVQATRQPEPSGGRPPRVVLHPGASGSALVVASNIPVGAATSCSSYSGLLVTPPDGRVSTRLVVRLPGCAGLVVQPMVAGPSGQPG